MSELPGGWTETIIGEVTESMKNGLYKPAAAYADDGVACLRMYNIYEGKIVWKNIKRMKLSLDEIQDYQLLPGDLLVNRVNSRELVGKAAIISDGLETCVFESKNIRVQFRREVVCPELANYALLLGGQRHFTSNAQQVVGMASISQPQIAAFPLQLPPLNEQRRIVAKLEKLLSHVDAAQARLATIPCILKRFRQSVLAAACSGRLTADWREENPKGERATTTIDKLKVTANAKVRRGVPESVQVSDLVVEWELPEKWAAYSTAELLRCGAFVDVKDGNHGANHPKVSEFTKTGLPFITAAQVNNYRIDYEGAYKLSGEPLDRIRVGFAKSGDVIYTHKGSVGRVAVADRDCVLTPQTTYYRVNPDVFSNRFVMFYLASHAFSEQVNVVKEQTTRDFVPISEQYLLFQRLPPVAEQQEIVRRVEALFTTADALEARYRKAKAHVDKLTQSILARAFRGELVPQDPNDEPASVLLERIRKMDKEKTSRKLVRPKRRRASAS